MGPKHMGQIIGGLAMSGRGEGLLVAHQLRGNLFRGRTGSKGRCTEGIAPLRNLFSRSGGSCRYPDGRAGLLYRPWQQGDVFIVVEFARVRELLLGPGRMDNLQTLPE